MEEKRERAHRVVAYLEARTVRNGCTPAEEQQAKAKADEIRKRYGLDAPANPYPDPFAIADALRNGTILDIVLYPSGPTFDDLLSSIIMEAEGRAFGMGPKRRRSRRRHVRVFTFKFN